MIIFIFSLSHPFATYFGLKCGHNGIFQLFEWFCYFFGIFYYTSCRNGTDRRFLFFLFLGIFHPILTWNEVIMVYFNFLNFIAIFLEFSISRRIGAERNGTIIFIFSHSRPFQTYFGLKGSHNGIFKFFKFFSYFFFEFSITRRVGTERTDNFYILSLSAFSNQFWLEKKP